jgi:hypothetical protein
VVHFSRPLIGAMNKSQQVAHRVLQQAIDTEAGPGGPTSLPALHEQGVFSSTFTGTRDPLQSESFNVQAVIVNGRSMAIRAIVREVLEA